MALITSVKSFIEKPMSFNHYYWTNFEMKIDEKNLPISDF